MPLHCTGKTAVEIFKSKLHCVSLGIFEIYIKGWIFFIIKMFFLTIVLSIVYFLSKSLFVEFLSIITVFITIFSFFFFRNPQRYVNINDNNILSPADGTIMSIEDDNIKDLGR